VYALKQYRRRDSKSCGVINTRHIHKAMIAARTELSTRVTALITCRTPGPAARGERLFTRMSMWHGNKDGAIPDQAIPFISHRILAAQSIRGVTITFSAHTGVSLHCLFFSCRSFSSWILIEDGVHAVSGLAEPGRLDAGCFSYRDGLSARVLSACGNTYLGDWMMDLWSLL